MSGAGTAVAGWPLAGVLALVLAAERLRATRRRVALNRALHELRRPLQLLALGIRGQSGTAGPGPVQLAVAALSQLDQEINGGGQEVRRLVSARELAGGAVGRWRPRARLRGATLVLRWRAGRAPLLADPERISQALDNLIVNALQHGGPHVVVEARSSASRLRIAVVDDGCEQGAAASPVSRPKGSLHRPGGRHGHGLTIVRSIAAAHRGRFVLQRSDSGSIAMLELPLAGAGGAQAA